MIEWCDATFKTQWKSKLPLGTSIHVYDRDSQRLRFKAFTGPSLDANNGLLEPELSASGNLLATRGYSREPGLSVWNSNPFPRWPWAISAALLAFLLAYFFPMLERRSKTRVQTVPSPNLA